MAKIESAIREAIRRGARREIRAVAVPVRRDVRRLRRTLAELRREMRGLREAAERWQRMARATPWRPEVSEAELRAARLSPGLIRKLRTRLRLSQVALARLVGVSSGAVVQWERGRSTPSGQNRKNLVALRKLGRRDAKRLLAEVAGRASRPRRPRRRGRSASRRSRAGK